MSDEVQSALIGLGGALLGALISWIATARTEGRRLKHEEAWNRAEHDRHLADTRREAYVEYFAAISAMASEFKEQSSTSDEIVSRWMAAYGRIEIVSSKPVREAAHCYSHLVSEQYFSPNPTPSAMNGAGTRERLMAAIRKELGSDD